MGEPIPDRAAVAQAKIYEEKELLCVLLTKNQLRSVMMALPDDVVHTSAPISLKQLQNRKLEGHLVKVIIINLARAAQRRIEELVS